MGLKNHVFDHETRKSGQFPCYRLKINDFLSSYNQNLKINIFAPLQQVPCYCRSRLGTLQLISWWRVTFVNKVFFPVRSHGWLGAMCGIRVCEFVLKSKPLSTFCRPAHTWRPYTNSFGLKTPKWTPSSGGKLPNYNGQQTFQQPQELAEDFPQLSYQIQKKNVFLVNTCHQSCSMSSNLD